MIERHEEILEAVWVSSEKKEYSIDSIKSNCDINFVEEDLKQLESKELIVRSGEKILFSQNGTDMAQKVIRRQRLAKVLLNSILLLKNSRMEELACKIEHTLLPEVEESICILLGHPQICPNGWPIPPGKCCKKKIKTVNSAIYSLQELEPGEKGKVAYIKPEEHSQLHQLMSFGLTPGVIITVHRTTPAFCIKFENTELALDKEIAKNIFVLKCNLLY